VSGLPDLSGEIALPIGFRVGHWTDPEARTGCTVILPPPGTRGSVDVRGGGTGGRELENLSPLANSEGPTAVLLTGGSAFGLAAADGVVRWLEERGLGRPTHAGIVPLVSTAVVFDLVAGSSARRPGPADAYAAFLQSRKVDHVIIFHNYDTYYRTNEHALLDSLTRAPALAALTPTCATLTLRAPAFDVYAIDRQECEAVASHAPPTRPAGRPAVLRGVERPS